MCSIKKPGWIVVVVVAVVVVVVVVAVVVVVVVVVVVANRMVTWVSLRLRFRISGSRSSYKLHTVTVVLATLVCCLLYY